MHHQHSMCIISMCMACAWHVHDMCLPAMCLVCAWCVPGVCPGTVISTPPHTPQHTHAMFTQPHTPPPHAGAVGAITAVAACGPKHPMRHAAAAAVGVVAATHHMCRCLHGRCRAHCCRTSRPPRPPAAAATACAARCRRCCMLPLPDLILLLDC